MRTLNAFSEGTKFFEKRRRRKMDMITENRMANILFGQKGSNNLFRAKTFAILTKDGPDRFRLLRELVVGYSAETLSVDPNTSYDHKKVENISKGLMALTASDLESNSWLELFAEPFDKGLDSNAFETIATEKIIENASFYYTLGLVLGIFQSNNWLDKNWTKNVLAEKIPETLAKIIFCLNKLTESCQIHERYESELAKAVKQFLRDTPYWQQRITMLMKTIYEPITHLKNTSTIGQLIVEQLNYAIFGALNFTSRIDFLAMYWQELNKKQ